MVNKTERSKEFLLRALRELPSDNALSEVRQYLQAAINKLEHVEKKRTMRQQGQPVQQSNWQFDLESGLVNPYNPVNTIKALDAMISQEQSKLEAMQNKQQPQQQTSSPKAFQTDTGVILG
mgnify:CR=1 FL=1